MVKVTEGDMNRLSSVSRTIMQSLTFITFMVSEKIRTLNFSTCFVTHPDDWLARQWSLQKTCFFSPTWINKEWMHTGQWRFLYETRVVGNMSEVLKSDKEVLQLTARVAKSFSEMSGSMRRFSSSWKFMRGVPAPLDPRCWLDTPERCREFSDSSDDMPDRFLVTESCDRWLPHYV